MFQNYNQYLQWLQSCLQAQESRIIALEKTVQRLTEEVTSLKEKPSIHVDTIEYKFDQLKVETLEGTLNIGLNPGELQGIEDFAVNHNNQAAETPIPPQKQMQRAMEIEETILHYLESDLPVIIEETQKKLGIQVNEAAYLPFVKEDIKKQLPTRIDFHLKAAAKQDRSPDNTKESNEKIIERLKQEIQNGVTVFFKHLPEMGKGMSKENEL
ncbi:spore germination protein GerPC [Neobacillus sp. SM06]|uniref:spore germination protein GerPC n=1 Tax=Neobacillus sp. SM06 TaxID=3422492 RepID=UPI003D2BC045